MLTLRKVGILSFEFKGSGMGSAYTDTKIQKIDSEFFGSNYLEFLYSAGSLYSQLGVCTPSNYNSFRVWTSFLYRYSSSNTSREQLKIIFIFNFMY